MPGRDLNFIAVFLHRLIPQGLGNTVGYEKFAFFYQYLALL